MPDMHSMPTNDEIQRLQRADRIRALWKQVEGRLKTERAELIRAQQIAQALKTDVDGANKVKATRDAIVAHIYFAQSRWQSILAIEGLREADWESDMTRTERAQRDALVAIPKPVGEKSGRPKAQAQVQAQAQAKSRPATPKAADNRWRPSTPQNGVQMRILKDQRHTKVMVTASALGEDETVVDDLDDGNLMELIELPSLTPMQTEYLENVGFFDDMKKRTTAMKEDFRRHMRRKKRALEVQAARSGITHKGAAHDFRINREEAQYLHKIDFAEEEEWIRLMEYMTMFKEAMSDNQAYWDYMHRRDLTRPQLLHAYREHLKQVEERSRKWEEEAVKKAMAQMKKTLVQYVLDPDLANRKADAAAQKKTANSSPPFMTSRIWPFRLGIRRKMSARKKGQ
ncbi:hypothetical protein EWM64_g3458 [Hericium alpestre]|uniref:Uncharacterized protein n=1 Tax=Hericium alpestre TaxID=135208 RepID=A0A4Z0A2W3_9AGAM|nr:hypothetical protein EWM64_g3458 [Hericium alpestre]